MNGDFDVKKLKEYLDFDYGHIQRSRERQCRAWRGEKLDVPILFVSGSLTRKQEEIPAYDLRQIFTDKKKMLCREIIGACRTANARSDSVPSIRANLGCGILLSCLGLEQEAYPDKMPWLHEHLNKAQISNLTVDDLAPRGSFARGLEMMRFFKETMGELTPVYIMDTQGPFDVAHLMLGDDLFLELYDDPPFVHHLMNLCLELELKAHRWMKEAIDEPLTAHHHGCSMYSDSFGIRICEDTSILLGEEHLAEFVIPYSQRLAAEFGGAWVHYCGYSEALTDAILACPELKVLNFGLIAGHEHEIDFFANMEKFSKAGKINYNSWPKFPDESVEDHYRRLHKFASQGVLAPITSGFQEPGFSTAAGVIDFWKNI